MLKVEIRKILVQKTTVVFFILFLKMGGPCGGSLVANSELTAAGNLIDFITLLSVSTKQCNTLY